MNRKTALAGLALLGAGALALSACSGGGTSNPSGSDNPSTASLPLVGWEKVPYDNVKDGGTLNLAVGSSPTDEGSWNPSHANAANVDVMNLLAPTLGQLGVATDDGEWKANPDYASSIELSSQDPQVVDIKLNPKAVWQDGTPITADDWKATIVSQQQASLDAGYEVISSSIMNEISAIDVKAADEFTVTFKEAYADWGNLAFIPVVPKAIDENKDEFNTGYAAKPIPSAGPYVFDKVDNDAKIYTLKPNPSWWGQKPKLDSLTFKVVTQESQPQSYANNEINALEVATPDALDTAQKKGDAVIQRTGGVTWTHLTFNGTTAPFDDVKVRTAVAMGIDRETISRVANEPLGTPAVVMGDWMYMPGQKGYKDIFDEKVGTSTDKAMKLLEEAGWKHEGKKWTKDGKTLSFDIMVPAGTQTNINRALGVQDSMKKMDIEVNLKQVPSADYFKNIEAKQFQAVTFSWQGTLFPVASGESLYTPADSPQNYPGITDPKLADLWKKANSELDPDARVKIANEIDETIAAYMPSVPFYPSPQVVAVDGDVVNYGTATFASVDWTTVGFKK